METPAYRNIFLKVDPIQGLSEDDKHPKWIDIDGYSSSITGEGNYNAQQQKTWRASHSDMSVAKSLDQTSPKLAEAASLGTPFDEVTIEICRILEEKELYMTYKMSKVVIAAYHVEGGLGVPSETFAFRYEKIEWRYKGGFTASWAIPQHAS